MLLILVSKMKEKGVESFELTMLEGSMGCHISTVKQWEIDET